jgi:hypothetical protein
VGGSRKAEEKGGKDSEEEAQEKEKDERNREVEKEGGKGSQAFIVKYRSVLWLIEC